MINRKLFIIPSILLLSASGQVFSDEQYPAADFQPKVLYSNPVEASEDTVSTESTNVTHAGNLEQDSKFPATSFEPKLLYRDENYQHHSESAGISVNEQSSIALHESDNIVESGTETLSAVNDNTVGIKNDYYILAGLIMLFFMVAHFSKAPHRLNLKQICSKLKIKK